MGKKPFTKRALSPDKLLTKLKSQGLAVPPSQEAQALAYLRYVGGYRLKGYWHHLVDLQTKRFPVGCTFTDISNRYEIDREVRATTIKAIERLEVAVRSVMANYLSMKHSPHWFLKSDIFKPTQKWGVGQLIRKIEDEVGRSKSKRFVNHYFKHHDDPYLPPSWSISECVSFGLWSRTYAILRDANDKKAISNRFGVSQSDVFQSWLHTLTVVRNLAAHHGQLINVQLGVAPANYNQKNIRFSEQKSFFASATVIQYTLNRIELSHSWKDDLQQIFARYPNIDIADFGFPENWQTSPGWQITE